MIAPQSPLTPAALAARGREDAQVFRRYGGGACTHVGTHGRRTGAHRRGGSIGSRRPEHRRRAFRIQPGTSAAADPRRQAIDNHRRRRPGARVRPTPEAEVHVDTGTRRAYDLAVRTRGRCRPAHPFAAIPLNPRAIAAPSKNRKLRPEKKSGTAGSGGTSPRSPAVWGEKTDGGGSPEPPPLCLEPAPGASVREARLYVSPEPAGEHSSRIPYLCTLGLPCSGDSIKQGKNFTRHRPDVLVTIYLGVVHAR